MSDWKQCLQSIDRYGEIEHYESLKLVANGPPQVFVGELCEVLDRQNQRLMHAEVVGFAKGKVFLMPFSNAKISLGCKVRALGQPMTIPVGESLLGRVVDAFVQPLDSQGPLLFLKQRPALQAHMNPLQHQRITERLKTGIHAIDCLLPLGKGQRIGLFAGSGVGKSFLLGKIAQQIQSDINVIAFVGERGREVNDFIQIHLQKQVLQKTVVVASCSNEPALMRKQAVFTATAIAEYFCALGKDVVLLLDSMTRFAMAQREISLSLGEPPTARGYTPTVFSLLPTIIERAGNFKDQGSITAIYTVLVEGDDFNEPIADNMRALLDGHIVLTRELAQRGHFPAIDVLQSVSRLAPQLLTPDEQNLAREIITMLSHYNQNKDLIAVGAYKPGNNLKLDRAVERIDAIQQLLVQTKDESLTLEQLVNQFSEILQ